MINHCEIGGCSFQCETCKRVEERESHVTWMREQSKKEQLIDSAKEYAIKLISKYKGFSCTSCFGAESNLITAKQCAEICVNEIINSNFGEGYNHEFYLEVLKQIKIY